MSKLPPKLGLFTRARMAWKLLSASSYIGADRSRRATRNWVTSQGDADTDILFDLPTLRERSRDAIRNNPIALGAINTKVTNIVGAGLKLNAQIDAGFLGMSDEQAEQWQDAVEREFNAWACSPDSCDIQRTSNFYDLQALAFRSTLENGDVFALLPDQMYIDGDYGLKIQLIEADRCSNPGRKSDTSKLAGGIERDDNGAPVQYHITDKHPGQRGAKLTWQSYPAFGSETGRRNVLHLYHQLRVGQTRGVPDLAPITEMLKELSDYSKAELDAAVVTSFLGIVTTTPTRQGLGAMAGTSAASDKNEPYKLGPAVVLDLAEGEDVKVVDPNRPNANFDPFVLAILRQIGIALELPYELLIKHFTSSYSAARAAMEDAKRFFKVRRSWLASRFCQPIYELFLYEAIASGRIIAPGFLQDPQIRRAYSGTYIDQWIGPAWASIDPKKENEAYEIEQRHGWRTAQEITAEKTGGDWRKKVVRRNKEMQMLNSSMDSTPALQREDDDQDDDNDQETEQ